MNTDRLIDALAQDAASAATARPGRRFALSIASGMIVSSLLVAGVLGPRADLLHAVRDPWFWVRLAFPASLAVAAIVSTLRLSRPGVRVGAGRALCLLLPVIAVWLLAAVTIQEAPNEERLALVLGSTWKVCSTLITLLSLPLIAAVFWAVRGMAPVRLRLAGAAAGLLAGALAALAYCLHCPEMAPPFWAAWYVAGILLAAGLGALAGPRFLHW